MSRTRRAVPAAEFDTIHWKCPDCMEPCGCTDELARLAPHRPCGRPKIMLDDLEADPGWPFRRRGEPAVESGIVNGTHLGLRGVTQ